MKLKRLLVRYERPGIGLEIENEGVCEVRHRDLPDVACVKSVEDIKVLVDDIIAGESALLTKRKHRTALLELLGRLYPVNIDSPNKTVDVETDQAAPVQSHAQPAGSEFSRLQEGQNVVLTGLKGKLQIHNGELATISKAREDKGRYEVTLCAQTVDTPEVLKFKDSQNLVPVAQAGTLLMIDQHVVIHALRNHMYLNGCLGKVEECHVGSHPVSHRYEVRALQSGQLFRVKHEHLVAVEFCPQIANSQKENHETNVISPSGGAGEVTAASDKVTATADVGSTEVHEHGSVVQLVNLKTAHAYNGQIAEVLSFDRAKARYEIRLQDGAVKTIRAENVRLVPKDTLKPKRGSCAATNKAGDRKG